MSVFYHEGTKYRYRKSKGGSPCILCKDPIQKFHLEVRDKGITAHFRCAYPQAYYARETWVLENANRYRTSSKWRKSRPYKVA
jgi:hypothetical protein